MTTPHPLVSTAQAAGAVYPGKVIEIGSSGVDDTWTRCDEVDPADIAAWEALASAGMEERFGNSHPTTTSAFVLGWYAHVPGLVAGIFYALHRRVPAVGRSDLILRRNNAGHVERVALADPRFLCLPDDPEAEHPDATVIDDVDELARRLRAAVREHADDFIPDHVGGGRLAMRTKVGLFFDGLEIGLWVARSEGQTNTDILDRARHALSDGAPEFEHSCGLRIIEDGTGSEHLSRQRVSCCYYYKIDGVEDECFTCPRTSDEARAARLTALAEAST